MTQVIDPGRRNVFQNGKERLFRIATNFRGASLRDRYVVFESDDWGMFRVRNPDYHRKLKSAGIDVTSCRYDFLDCLESQSDMDQLLNLLDSHRNSAGSSPRFTMNVILGNPDLDAIRATGFEEYVFQDLFETYRQHHGEELKPVWEQASAEGLVRPQFHGREHLNVRLWLDDLRSGNRDTRTAFDHCYYGLEAQTSSPRQKNYLAAFWPTSTSHMTDIKGIAEDGLDRFEKLFGYRSRSFIACNYVLPRALEPVLSDNGVELIQGQRGQTCPSSDGSTTSIRRAYTGQRNQNGQYYSVRNVNFEPFEDPSRDWVSSAMQEIKSAFFWGTPAIVSTHRVNYVGGMDIQHRDRSLRLLDTLLKNIVEAWPDVQFITSDELTAILQNQNVSE